MMTFSEYVSKTMSDIPSPNLCYIVNPDLWEIFHNVFKSDEGIRPSGDWTEEEVTQYLDNREISE
jgi:hypothetical protein